MGAIPQDDCATTASTEVLERLARHVRGNEASVVISWHRDHFVVGSEWGQEAPDSPMAGAAAYGAEPDLVAALESLLSGVFLPEVD